MKVPTVQDLIYYPKLRQEWRICSSCQGGRGSVEPIRDEAHPLDDNSIYIIVPCVECFGQRVLPR